MINNYKHNKKRNVAILYEVLVKELTKSFIQKDLSRKNIILDIIKENFNNKTEVFKELSLYRCIYECQEKSKDIVHDLLKESQVRYKEIDKTKVYNEQSRIISRINKELGPKIFSHHIPNYKYLATIHNLFNSKIEIRKKILLENNLVEDIISNNKRLKKNDDENYDSFVCESFIDSFNEKYKNDILLEEQKKLISNYIKSYDDAELKFLIEEEIERLKNSLKIMEFDDRRIPQVLLLIEDFKNHKMSVDFLDPDNKILKQVLQIQELVNELKLKNQNEIKNNL